MSAWQFDGVAAFSELASWCYHNLPEGSWTWKNETLYFFDEKYHTMFLLRWS
jgi:hypothetical protein